VASASAPVLGPADDDPEPFFASFDQAAARLDPFVAQLDDAALEKVGRTQNNPLDASASTPKPTPAPALAATVSTTHLMSVVPCPSVPPSFSPRACGAVQVVGYLVDWNTNAKHAYVSQALLAALVRVVRTDRLLTLRAFAEATPGLLAYSERHFSRVDRLHQASYVLEYMASMMRMLPLEGLGAGEEGLGRRAATSSSSSSNGAMQDEEEDETPVFFAPLLGGVRGGGGGDDDDDDDDDDEDDRHVGGTNGNSNGSNGKAKGKAASEKTPKARGRSDSVESAGSGSGGSRPQDTKTKKKKKSLGKGGDPTSTAKKRKTK